VSRADSAGIRGGGMSGIRDGRMAKCSALQFEEPDQFQRNSYSFSNGSSSSPNGYKRNNNRQPELSTSTHATMRTLPPGLHQQHHHTQHQPVGIATRDTKERPYVATKSDSTNEGDVMGGLRQNSNGFGTADESWRTSMACQENDASGGRSAFSPSHGSALGVGSVVGGVGSGSGSAAGASEGYISLSFLEDTAATATREYI
jgi:hypothetical protein